MSGGSLGVLQGVLESIPVVGTHLMLWVFGGDVPGQHIIPRLFWVHALLPVVMAGLFVLRPPGSPDDDASIEVRPLSPAELFVEVIRSTFHEEIDDEKRLVRHFASARHVSSAVSGYALRYPRGYEHLPALRAAIVETIGETDEIFNTTRNRP